MHSPTSAEVLAQIDSYASIIGGVAVFPIFAQAGNKYPTFNGAKASPDEFQAEFAARFATIPADSRPQCTPEQARSLMLQEPVLGVDCSAFVYHILHGIAEARRDNFDIYLSKPKSTVKADAERWRNQHPEAGYPWAVEEENYLANVGTRVPMQWVAEHTGRSVASQTNIERLCDPTASRPISLEELSAGDMVVFRREQKRKHIGIVAVRGSSGNHDFLQIWDSGFSTNADIDGHGGIGSHDVTIAELRGPIRDIPWSTELDEQFDQLEFRRPLMFDDADSQLPDAEGTIGF